MSAVTNWKRFKRIVLYLAGAFLVAEPLRAEASTSPQLTPSYGVSRWTSEDGLPANRITALAQTPDGYLWVGTWFGLLRFDGDRFSIFNRYNTPAMVNDAINALAVDTRGKLWIGTADGVLVLDETGFRRFTRSDGLPGPGVFSLARSAAGGVWMEADGKVTHFRGQGASLTVDLMNRQAAPIRSIGEDSDGSLFVVMSSGIKRVTNDGELSQLAIPPWNLEGDYIFGILLDRQNRFWISTHTEFALCSEGSRQVLQGPCRTMDASHRMFQDRAGAVWLSRGMSGFWRYQGTKGVLVRLNERGSDPAVECMLEDREGHLWLGTDNGLYQLRPKLIRSYSSADGLPDDECWSVCEGPDGTIWAGTRSGVARIQNGEVQTSTDHSNIWLRPSILSDADGTLWLGHGHDGIVAWQPGVATNWFWSNSKGHLHALPSGFVLESLYLDRTGRVWAGTERGVTWFENGLPVARRGEFDLPADSVRSIYQTRAGAMWFGTLAGAVLWGASPMSGQSETNRSLLKPEATRFTTAQGLADNRVFVFHEDADGALWIGTHYGLSRFKEGRFFTFRTEHGLLDNLINWMEEDQFGRFWFSCNRGIFRIDRRELNQVAEGTTDRANAAVYGTADGMLSPETNGEHQPAGCKDHTGKLWFPTTHGLVVIDPATLKDNDAPPPLAIEEVWADGELIGGNALQFSAPTLSASKSRLILEPGRARALRFRYTANSFSDPKRIRFRYRLVPRDAAWGEVTDERVAYYTDLRPGQYRFELMAANAHGVWSESPEVFPFALEPGFTQTFWFPLSGGLAILALSGALATWRLRWQRRLSRLEQQRALANERTRIARDLHDDLGTALTGLALELDVIRKQANGEPAASLRLQSTAGRTRELAERMREVVWAVNPKCDTVSSLASFLEQQTAQFLQADGIRGRLEFPEEIPAWPVDSETRHQLTLAVREALTNVVRHSNATEVVLKLSCEARTLVLQVIDNGRGFAAAPEIGHGLRNMAERLERIGGSFSHHSAPGHGAALTFRIPLSLQSEMDERARP